MESLAKKISEIILSIESSKISAKGAGHKPKNNTAIANKESAVNSFLFKS